MLLNHFLRFISAKQTETKFIFICKVPYFSKKMFLFFSVSRVDWLLFFSRDRSKTGWPDPPEVSPGSGWPVSSNVSHSVQTGLQGNQRSKLLSNHFETEMNNDAKGTFSMFFDNNNNDLTSQVSRFSEMFFHLLLVLVQSNQGIRRMFQLISRKPTNAKCHFSNLILHVSYL